MGRLEASRRYLGLKVDNAMSSLLEIVQEVQAESSYCRRFNAYRTTRRSLPTTSLSTVHIRIRCNIHSQTQIRRSAAKV